MELETLEGEVAEELEDVWLGRLFRLYLFPMRFPSGFRLEALVEADLAKPGQQVSIPSSLERPLRRRLRILLRRIFWHLIGELAEGPEEEMLEQVLEVMQEDLPEPKALRIYRLRCLR
jgi:hypothetical protein